MKAGVVRLDTRTVLVAGTVAFAFGLVANIAFVLIDTVVDFGSDSNWVFAFALFAWTGSGMAGVIAGRARPDTPLTHAALAALGAHSLNALINIVFSAATGEDDIGQLVITLVVLASIPTAVAVLTAYVTARHAHR